MSGRRERVCRRRRLFQGRGRRFLGRWGDRRGGFATWGSSMWDRGRFLCGGGGGGFGAVSDAREIQGVRRIWRWYRVGKQGDGKEEEESEMVEEYHFA